MSMTSKINPTLRSQIISLLSGGALRSNGNIRAFINLGGDTQYSRRAIQEATQKLTKESILESSRIGGLIYYSIKKVERVKPVETKASVVVQALLLASHFPSALDRANMLPLRGDVI